MTYDETRHWPDDARRAARERWIALAFDERPADVPAAVTAMWAAGEASTETAAWVLDTDFTGLLRLADEHGVDVVRELTLDERRLVVAEMVRLGEEWVRDSLVAWQSGEIDWRAAAKIVGARDIRALRWICGYYSVEIVREDSEGDSATDRCTSSEAKDDE